MSEEAAVDNLDANLDISAPRKRLSGKRIVLFIVLPILLLGGGGAGVMFSGLLGGAKHAGETDAAHATPSTAKSTKTVFYDLPEMVVNLNSRGRRPNFLKIQVSLELPDESDIDRLDRLRPRILHNFQVYLRELRMDDLRGSAGIHRLREELLARVNAAVEPTKVVDVLFKEVLVQ